MNHSDSAKKSFAKMTFYAAKRVSKNDDFFAFSHFIPWCVFSKTRQGIEFHVRGLKDSIHGDPKTCLWVRGGFQVGNREFSKF